MGTGCCDIPRHGATSTSGHGRTRALRPRKARSVSARSGRRRRRGGVQRSPADGDPADLRSSIQRSEGQAIAVQASFAGSSAHAAATSAPCSVNASPERLSPPRPTSGARRGLRAPAGWYQSFSSVRRDPVDRPKNRPDRSQARGCRTRVDRTIERRSHRSPSCS